MQRTLIGVLTPSSNTVLEPLTFAMMSELDNVSAHFARFRVTEISKTTTANAQFEIEKQLAAAEQLADAQVEAIVWSGTSAGWLGFEQDQRLCEAIQKRTGIPAGSSMLAINDLFTAAGVKKFGLVTPYTNDIQESIVTTYAAQGFNCVSERHIGLSRNFEFSEITETVIGEMIEEVAVEKPDAITIICTNLRAAQIAPCYEKKLGIPVFDSTSAAVWAALKIVGKKTSQLKEWGRMFEMQ